MAGDRLPLPKCSYVNTDFPGDDLFPYDDDDGVVDEDDYEKRGINAGSARYFVSLSNLVKCVKLYSPFPLVGVST